MTGFAKRKTAEFTQTEKVCTLNLLAELPPDWQLEAPMTNAQRERVLMVKEEFTDLAAALDAYFNGLPNPFADDPLRRRIVETLMQYYLSFYNLAWYGWSEVVAEVKRTFDPEAIADFPSSPGELLRFVLRESCRHQVETILSDVAINVRESKTLLKGDLPDRATLKGPEAKRLDRTLAYATEVTERLSTSALMAQFVKQATKKRLRGNSTLREMLTRYKTDEKQYLRTVRLSLEGVKGITI
jgi:hypothetical protein